MNVVIKQMTVKRGYYDTNAGELVITEDVGVFPASFITMSNDEYSGIVIGQYNGAINIVSGVYSDFSLTASGNLVKEQFAGPITAIRGIHFSLPDDTKKDGGWTAYVRNQFFPVLVDCDLTWAADSGSSTKYYGFVIYENESDEFYYIVYIGRYGLNGQVNVGYTGGIYHNIQYPYYQACSNIPPILSYFCDILHRDYQNGAERFFSSVPIYITDTQSVSKYSMASRSGGSAYSDTNLYCNKAPVSLSSYPELISFFESAPGPTPGSHDIADCTISVEPLVYLYDGQAKTPIVRVYNGERYLAEGTEYLKTYENNINPGTASVLVAGIGDYTGSQRVNFTIRESEEPTGVDYRVTLPKYSYDYTGEPIMPYVNVVTVNGTIMVEGTDYQKTYQNNTLPGQASVLVVGIGDYADSGSKIVYFNIVGASPDPYSPLGPSGPAEGQGTFNPVSDTLPAYTLPTLNISNTGFTRIYNPTLSQVQSLAQYMWTDPSFFQTLFNKLIQVFENPMDAIIAFNIVPCEIPDGGTEEFKVLYLGTGVNMTVAAQQYVAVDCGTVTISEFFGSALDYNPYTKIKCYLPYIGTIELDTDEVMNETLHLVYTIDIVSGACIAQIYIDDIPIYQFSGHCAQYIPMAASDFSSYVSALIGISKIVAGAVAAGAGAGADSGAVMNANGLQLTGQTLEKTTERNPSTGRQITTGTVATEQWSLPPTQASFASQVPGIIANTVGQVVGSKIGVAHTGTFSGASGFMAYANPFIRIERPRLVNPAEYGHFNGRPSMITRQLNQLSGYTVVQQVQLTGFTCTQPEMEEISTLLKGGVVF